MKKKKVIKLLKEWGPLYWKEERRWNWKWGIFFEQTYGMPIEVFRSLCEKKINT